MESAETGGNLSDTQNTLIHTICQSESLTRAQLAECLQTSKDNTTSLDQVPAFVHLWLCIVPNTTVNIRSQFGKTPLHHLCENTAITAELLQCYIDACGAEVCLVQEYDETKGAC